MDYPFTERLQKLRVRLHTRDADEGSEPFGKGVLQRFLLLHATFAAQGADHLGAHHHAKSVVNRPQLQGGEFGPQVAHTASGEGVV